MKKILPIFIIIAVVCVFFYQFLLHGLLPIPSDTLIGLYHPFRDLYAQQFPRGISFKNFLITDPIRQQYPWRQLAISLEKQFQLPLWNPYSFSGYPLLANFQSAPFYPLNILFFLLPFSFAWSILIFLQPLLAGLFLYLYLRNLKLHPFAALIGAIAFAFSGFSIAWLEWGTIMQTLMWVPLILLAKDKLIKKWTKRWMFIFFFAEACSLLAGHLQIWFYALCITNIYLFVRIFQKTNLQKTKNFFLQYLKNYFPFFLVGLGMFILTAIQWIPTVQFIFLSARSIDQSFLQQGWFVPYQNLIQFIVPDFFGNPTTLNYWGIWNYGEFVGYIGILPLIFALFALFFRHDKKTYFFGLLSVVALLFALPTPLAQLPYLLHIPFISTSQPTRLMGVIDFSLAILVALGMDYFFKKKSFGIVVTLGMFGVFLGTFWTIVMKFYPFFGITVENAHIAKQNLLFPTALFFISSFVLILLVCVKNKYSTLLLRCIIVVIICVDLVRFGWKFTPFTPKAYLYPPAAVISFLQNNIANYRFMTTDSEILPPNVSDMYHLQSIEGYDPLYIENYGAFIAAMQRNKPDVSTPFGFNRIITPHNPASPLINVLGVKYVLSLDDIQQKGLKKVFQEGQTRIYQNTNVLPRAFFVSHIVLTTDNQDAINKVFINESNLGSTAVVEDLQKKQIVGLGKVKIINYSANKIIISTGNQHVGFLVLSDIYYPTWHAFIDGKETRIYQTDFTFRGVFVPAGKHEVAFDDRLF